MSLCDSPFNKNLDNSLNYINAYNSCLNDKIGSVQTNLDDNIHAYQLRKDHLITAQQVNEDTMKLYINDYYYIITKGILYLLVLGIFIYFFGINNLIQGVQITGVVVKDKAIEIKDKVIEVKNKAVELKDKAVELKNAVEIKK
jgi:hypothetical protein